MRREFAAAVRRAPRDRRRYRHRRDRDRIARARHRPGRRSHHVAAFRRLQRAGNHDGRGAASVRGHRPGEADHRSRGRGGGRNTADRRDPAGPSLRTAGGHDGHRAVAERHDLAIVEDCCQAHLATCDGRPVGSFGAAAAYSFYPTKNLGALGDGGAIDDSRRRRRRPRQAAAERRPDRSLSACGVRCELAPRRNAGGHPSRAAALPATMDRSAPGARAAIVPVRLRDIDAHRSAGMRSGSRLSSVPRAQCRRAKPSRRS